MDEKKKKKKKKKGILVIETSVAAALLFIIILPCCMSHYRHAWFLEPCPIRSRRSHRYLALRTGGRHEDNGKMLVALRTGMPDPGLPLSLDILYINKLVNASTHINQTSYKLETLYSFAKDDSKIVTLQLLVSLCYYTLLLAGKMVSQNQPTPAAEQHAREVVRQLFDLILAQGDADYIGEPISQLEHSLQAAQLARESGADDETVLGALLHDVGRFIPAADKMPKMIAPDGTYVGRASHEVVGERYLRQLGFGEKVCQLVAAHVMAKRYLTAVDKEYYEGLSNSSKNTLKMQVRSCFHLSS